MDLRNQSAETQCSHCKEQVIVKFDINNIEAVSFDDDRGMGTETEYEFTEEVKCPNCEMIIEIEGSVWEYPAGVVNYIQLR